MAQQGDSMSDFVLPVRCPCRCSDSSQSISYCLKGGLKSVPVILPALALFWWTITAELSQASIGLAATLFETAGFESPAETKVKVFFLVNTVGPNGPSTRPGPSSTARRAPVASSSKRT